MVVSVPLPCVPSSQVAVQSTVMVELGESAASSVAVSDWVNDWFAAVGGAACSTGDAPTDNVCVLRVPWVVE